ncbi:MAG: SCO family protein [Vicinamibacterales bacterium]
MRLNSAFVLLPILLFLAAAVSAVDNATFKAGAFSPPRQAPDFSLRGSDGGELKLSRYRGKVVVLGFGFTSCPAICPTTLAVLAEARKKLSVSADDVQVVFVTVDPEKDDTELMRKYLASFDPTFAGGTGTAEQLAAVRQAYGVLAEKKPLAGGYTVAHSSFTYLIDRDGSLRALMPFGHTADDYVHDVKLLLNKRTTALK